MPHALTVVIIALDVALQRSLEFALRADGYLVKTFASWKAAETSVPISLCVIIDQDVFQVDIAARKGLLDPSNRIVLLAEHLSSWDLTNAQVLTKPLTGSDVLATVAQFRAEVVARQSSVGQI
jgi:hypothetical protein